MTDAEGFHGLPDPHHAGHKQSHYLKGSTEFAAMRAMVKSILSQPLVYRWTVQGFGFLRTYLPPGSKRFRLNLWHADLAIPNVSTIHDHPWSFDSWIINGEFRNRRFIEAPAGGDPEWGVQNYGTEYEWMRIKCGEDGMSLGDKPSRIRLWSSPTEHYHTGDKYHQEAEEIHLSAFTDGTVTLNDRTGDTEMPRVFWPAGSAWVDAKPREATSAEIAYHAAFALERWES